VPRDSEAASAWREYRPGAHEAALERWAAEPAGKKVSAALREP
jgi:hypothetical protein